MSKEIYIMHQKAEQLLQAHLQFILKQLQTEQTVVEETNALFAHLADKSI